VEGGWWLWVDVWKKEMFFSRTNRALRNLYFLWILKTLMLLFFSLSCIYNLSLVSNVCKAVPTSLFQAHNGFNELLETHSEFPFNLLVNWQWLFKQANHGAYSIPGTQVGTQTRISSLFRRRPGPEFSFICGAGYYGKKMLSLLFVYKFLEP